MDAPQPLTITKADIGRIVYALTELYPGMEPEIASVSDINTSAVIVADESSDQLGYAFLTGGWRQKPGEAPAMTVFDIEADPLYATQTEAIVSALVREQATNQRYQQFIDRLLAELFPDD